MPLPIGPKKHLTSDAPSPLSVETPKVMEGNLPTALKTQDDLSSLDRRSKPSPINKGNLALAVVVLGLTLIGQYFFSFVRDDFAGGLLFFVGAIFLFVILIYRAEAWSFTSKTVIVMVKQLVERIRNEPLKTSLVGLSFALAYAVIRLIQKKPDTQSYWDVFALWVISFVCYGMAFIRIPRFNLKHWMMTNRKDLVIVSILTVCAGIFRFTALGSIPNIISGDEGVLGTLSLNILEGNWHNMLATVYGNSTLYLYIIAGFIKLFGVNMMALRLGSAIAGTLAVPVLYILGRNLFSTRVGLVAAALLAVSNFHIHFSRVVVATGIQDVLFATLTFYFFLSGLLKRSTTRMVLAGLIVGLELYIYMGARLVILLLPVYIIVLLIVNKDMVKRNWGNLLAFAGALLIISGPMLYWALAHPDEFNARANQIGIIQSGWLANEARNTGLSQLQIFLGLFKQAFLTTNYYPSVSFHYSSMPMLDYLTGGIFILGLVYSLFHLKDPRYLLLNGWFWSGVLVGGALVVIPASSAYRIMIVFPALCLFVAIGWDRLLEFANLGKVQKRILQILPTSTFIALFALINLKTYFIDYAPTCTYEDVNTRLASYVGTYTGKLGAAYTPYLVTAPRINYGVYQSMEYLNSLRPMLEFKEPLTVPPTSLDPKSKAVFFFTPERQGELAMIQRVMPGGKVDHVYDCNVLLMTVYISPQP
jgi:4-amino-4-deoxy-L-arabinose transferase-like glycosyltransferase